MNKTNQNNVKAVGISLPTDVLAKGQQRAALFRMKFSHYIGMLIEKDCERGSDTITIHARRPVCRQ
jgi:hypothetical protein